jgi:predicted RNase H-like nuclease (RuvC/YqgF family)
LQQQLQKTQAERLTFQRKVEELETKVKELNRELQSEKNEVARLKDELAHRPAQDTTFKSGQQLLVEQTLHVVAGTLPINAQKKMGWPI